MSKITWPSTVLILFRSARLFRLTKATPTPLRRQIRSVLRHARPFVQNHPGSERINQILAMIPQSDELLMFDAFSTGEWDLDGEHQGLEAANRARQELLSRGVAAFRREFPDPRQQVAALAQLVNDAETAGIELDNRPYNFIGGFCSEDFVKEFFAYATNDGAHRLLAYMTIVAFRWLRARDRAGYKSAGLAAARHKNHLLGCGIADAISHVDPYLKTQIMLPSCGYDFLGLCFFCLRVPRSRT